MPEIQAPRTDPSQPLPFHFAVTWSSLYAPVPGSQKSVQQITASRPRAVSKKPGEPDFKWAMMVPKTYHPLPRRRRVQEIAPPPVPPPVPEAVPEPVAEPRHAEPRHFESPRIAVVAEKRIAYQGILAISAALVAASLSVVFIPHRSTPKRNASPSPPQSVAVAHFPVIPAVPAPRVQPEPATRSAAPASRASTARRRIAEPSEPPTQAPAHESQIASQAPAPQRLAAERSDPPATAPPASAPPASAPPASAPSVSTPAAARFAPEPSEPTSLAALQSKMRFVGEQPPIDDFESSRVLTKVKPIYPPAAKFAGVEGTVRLKATVGPDGTVQSAELVSGPSLLAQAAIDAVRHWTFLPATHNGKPIEDVIHINVSFGLVK